MTNNQNQPGKKGNKPRPNEFLRYTGMAIQMAVVILAGVFGGLKLDENRGGDSHIFTLIFSLLSVFIAIYFVIRETNR